jgi:hypothetical protein
MKKLVSISLGLFMLLASMHLTVATHFCGERIAATRVSFTGHLASCGMESDEATIPSSETNFAAHCCDNEISVYAVDNNFAPSEFHAPEIPQSIQHEFYVPAGVSFEHKYLTSLGLTNASPPRNFSANAVSTAGICVFRI